MKFTKILLLACLFSAPYAFGEGILGIDGEESTSVGIYVKDLATGKVIIVHNSQMEQYFLSQIKLVMILSTESANM